MCVYIYIYINDTDNENTNDDHNNDNNNDNNDMLYSIIGEGRHPRRLRRRPLLEQGGVLLLRSIFKFHVCFCGLDPGNLKFETVRTNQQNICF